ncbi:transposase [Scytonema hofmannii PCC 7110]|uniref:Transposase n=1 Tax=Scytonema hofmannii PCC 7110 TaxID=128403 RepID=A0A139X9Z6_9CYAN|nr:RNA-guided endonuclease TnpB family protein [Scytonema hofmannii]KYC36608.1 transposase [Scytonema hofmannii PCC 7110]KYC41528.1 transposase [Scytonema hofmannii PCC 7110]
MYKTLPVKARFTDIEQAFWLDQCQHANSLINCALYHVRQTHYSRLEESGNAFTTYWKGDELRHGWKTYRCNTTYPELDKILKDNPHYKALAAQAAQQTLKSIGESITSYNGLVNAYYRGEVDKPSLPQYRKSGGLAAVTFPRQALTYKNGCFYPSISRETKPHLLAEIALPLPEFIDSDWVKEVTVRPCYGQFWINWVIDDGKQIMEMNPNLVYTQAWSFDHGGNNWLTGVSTLGQSLIIDGRKLRSMNQGYCRLVAKYKQGKSDFYWDSNLDRIQRKRNNQMRDAINKAARFIINRCLADGVGNLIIGWNEGQKNGSDMGKRGNQNFVPIPTGRLIERLKQLCPEYGIVLTITEESYTSKSSFLDDDLLPTFGEKPNGWKPSGERIERGLYKTFLGFVINADCNGAANIMRKVATQLGLVLVKVGRAVLSLPHRYDLFRDLKNSFRNSLRSASLDHVATSI